MKNKSIRTLLTAFIITFSLGSYIFLNTTNKSNSIHLESAELQVQQVQTNESSTLPDIKVTKQMVNLAKKLLPVSH